MQVGGSAEMSTLTFQSWQRFWQKVDKTTGCWNWTASVAGLWPHRYGCATPIKGNSTRRAHRIAWLMTHGAIPEGLSVLHHCDNALCVRPDHLFLGTQQENVFDMVRKKRHHKQRVTHCPQGHPYEGENLKVVCSRDGKLERQCRACLRIAWNKSDAKRRAR